MTDLSARAYLLGQLTEAEAARLDERVLEEEEFFLSVRSAEDELFDEYVRNQMNTADRERFVARFGAQADRIAFAQALAQRTASSRPAVEGPAVKGKVIPFPQRRWVQLAAAAALVAAVVGVVSQRSGPAERIATATPPATRSGGAPPQAPFVVALTLGTSRSVSGSQAVAVPRDLSTVLLRVRLDPADKYEHYSMELRSSLDNIVWGDAALRASTEDGELTLSAMVPSGRLPNGVYELGVRGANGTSTPEDLGFVTLEVRRTP